jgi:hypothetical protein
MNFMHGDESMLLLHLSPAFGSLALQFSHLTSSTFRKIIMSHLQKKNTISNAKYSCIFPQNIPQKSGLKVSPPKKPGLKLQERMKYQGLWAHFWCLHGFSWLLQQLAASAELRLRRVERVKTTDLTVQLWATERRSGQLRDEVTYSGFHVFFGEP